MRHGMRTRSVTVVAGLVLLLGACSSDGDTAADTTTGDTTGDTSGDTTGDTTGDTSGDTTDTGDAADTAGDTDGSTVDTAALAGTYVGQWENTTFGSTGAMTVELSFDAAAGTFTATIDLDGGVFGEGDPDPFDITGSFSGDGAEIQGTSDLLGEFTFDIDETGAFDLNAGDVPSQGIATFTAEGTLGGGAVSGTYSVTFDGSGGAEGTFEASKS